MTNSTDPSSSSQVDLHDCDKEPIHIPERVQGHGFMVVCDIHHYQITRVSNNMYALVRLKPENLIGESLEDILDKYSFFTLQDTLAKGDFSEFNPTRIFFPENKQYYDAIAHVVQGELVLEFEPHIAFINVEALMTQMDTAFDLLKACEDVEALLDTITTKIKDISGFDRVMVYQFDEDWNGQVIREKHNEDMTSYLGLHFPATDIPAQARALYKKTQIRTITDTMEKPAYLMASEEFKEPLDMTDSILRGVSPMHLEYLQNMGVRATMSIAILFQNELWGLIACHHMTPKMIKYELRNSLKIIGQLFSSTLSYMILNEDSKYKAQLIEQEDNLYRQFTNRTFTPHESFNLAYILLALNPEASGAAIFLHQQLQTTSEVPADEELIELIDFLNSKLVEGIFYTTKLSAIFEPAKQYKTLISGVLIVQLSQRDANYLLWFKPERIQEVHWGGNPDKAVVRSENGGYRLSPRKSFEKFTEIVKGKSLRWSAREIRSALRIKERVKDILLKQHSEQLTALNNQLQKANDDLEAFSYSVSHDLRSPLRYIDNFAEILMEEYGGQLGEDGQALLQNILDGSQTMGELIKDLLEYSKIGRVNKIYNVFPLRPVLDDIIKEQLSKEDKERDIDIQIGDLPDIYGDRPLIKQLFVNLISNALKYSRTKAQTKIHIWGEQKEDQCVYSVQDNGVGFNTAYENRIYQVFSRLHSEDEYEGTGIGLAIVHRILQSHQGKVSVESQVGEGTTFYVSLPKH